MVTFDAGQTFIQLDLAFLARRLAERGAIVTVDALAAAAPAAWRHYDALVRPGGGHPWRDLMAALLDGAGVERNAVPALVDWLWHEQPRANLWRAPIDDMVALAGELRARGIHVAVLSNSEGRLAELLAEIGIADRFAAIIDSGRVGIEKPDPRIFAHALEALGARGPGVHIGDSWSADIAGALGAGWRAIWYDGVSGGRPGPNADDPRVGIAHTADDVRAILERWL